MGFGFLSRVCPLRMLLLQMRGLRPRLVWLVVAVVATALLTSGCERRTRDVSAVLAADSVDAGPSQTSWDVEFDLQEAGKRRARFIADKMEHFDTDDSSYVLLTMQPDSAMRSALQEVRDPDAGSRTTDPDGVDPYGADSGEAADPSETGDSLSAPPRRFSGFELPQDRVIAYVYEDGDSSAVITAIQMMFFADEGRFEAFGDVEVVTAEGKQLFSEQLTWDQTNRKIRTRRFVRIITPSEDVQGNGLLADEDLDTYQIGRFTANVDIDKEESDPDTTGGPSAEEPDSTTGSYVDP